MVVPTAPHDQPRTGPAAIAAHVRRHITQVDDGHQLITVRHQPLGPVAYLLEPDDELIVEAVDLVGGNVVTQAAHERWGRLYALPNGSSVTEVCLHETHEQAEAYREHARGMEAQYIQVLNSFDALGPGGDETDPDQPVPADG